MNIETMNAQFDRSANILEARGAFSPSKHPRDKNGRFTSKLGAAARSGGRALGKIGAVSAGRGEYGNALGNLSGGVAAGWGGRKGSEWGSQFARESGMKETGQLLAGIAGGLLLSGAAGRIGRDVGDSAGRAVGLRRQGNAASALTMYAGVGAGMLGVGGISKTAGSIGNFIDRKLSNPDGSIRGFGGRRPGAAWARANSNSAATFEERLAALRRNRRGR